MPIDCNDVVREISNYLDGDVDPALSSRMESHLGECRSCAALLSSLRNVVRLYGDERLFPLPEGFGARLNQRLAAVGFGEKRVLAWETPAASRRGGMTVRTWWGSAVAAALIMAVLFAGEVRDREWPALKSEHSQRAQRVPETMVVITDEGKTFHVPGCEYIHGRQRTVTAAEAVREGYAPCVRCEHALLARRRYPARRQIKSRSASRMRRYAPESGSTRSKWSAPAISTSVASSPRARARST